MSRARNPAQLAGILSQEEQFQRFAAKCCGFPGKRFQTQATAEFIRRQCKISSRRDLATNQDAHDRFEALRTDCDAWRGKIPTPRPGEANA